MPEPVKKDKCICQICTCGRHRCPHNPGGLLKFGNDDNIQHSSEYNALYTSNAARADAFQTVEVGQAGRAHQTNEYHPTTVSFIAGSTMQHDYPEWEVHPREQRQMSKYVKPEGKFDATTTSNVDYIEQAQTERVHAILPKADQVLSEGKFEGTTTSNVYYKAYEVEKRESYKPMAAAAVSQEPFESSTTTKAEYPVWEVQHREKRKIQEYVKPDGRFEGTTTSNADFGQISGERRQAIRHKDELVLSGDALQDATTAKHDYPEWEVQQREKRKTQEYVKPEGKFEGTTTSNADFGQISGERRQAIRHKDELVLSGDALQDATTAKHDYPEWEVQQREKRKTQEYVKPEGKFEGTTTSNADFGQISGERRQAIRHKDELVLSGDALQDATTAKHDYPEWEVQQREKRKTQEYVKPEGKFEGTTTSNADFGQISGERRQAIRHKDELVLSGDALQDATTAKHDYPEWEVQQREKRKTQEYVKPEGKFEGTTTSNADFGQISGERRQAIRHKDELVLSGDALQDATTAKHDYPEWEVQQREKRKTQEYVKPEGKFEGTTTSNADFGLITGERRQAIRHKDELVLSGDALQDATTAKHDYPEWEVQQREKRKTQEYVKPEGKFEGTTTSNADFGLISGERRQAIRHKDELVLSGDALQDATTAKHDYPEWEVQQREKRKTQEYVKPEGKFEGTTTNNADFGQISGERRQAIRHKDELVLSGDALQDATTAKHDYPEWEVQQREKRKTQEYVKPEGKFEGTTTSNADFGLITGERRQAIRHKDELVLSGDALQDATTAKHDYPEWEVQQREKRKTQEYVKPEGKFEGTTTSNADFGLISGERRQAIRHKDELVLSGDALQDATTAKHDYPEWEVQQREKRKTQEYVKPEEKFEGMTTSNADFGLITGERRQAIRHKDELVLSGDALQDATTAKHDYPEWEVQQREKRKTQEYVKPEGKFEGTTTSNADFGLITGERRQAIRHKDELVLSGDALQDATTAKHDYPEWEVQQREKRKTQEYVKPEEKFEGMTTSNADFGLITGERRQAIRHKDELVLSGDALQDATTAKHDYPEWEVQQREKRKTQEYVKPEGKFEGTTTSNADFGQISGERRQAIRHKDELVLSGDALQDATTAKHDYPEWEVQQREKRKTQEYVKPEGKFEGTTTSNADFGLITGERRQAIRHKDELVLSGDALQDATTAKHDYPEWEVQQREKRKTQEYVKPEGKFEGTTTSNADFGLISGERRQAIRHKDELVLSGDALQDATTAKHDYPEWEVQQREKRKTQEYVKPEEKFEGMTTSNADFGLITGERRQAIRHKDELVLSGDALQDATTAKHDYPEWEVQQREKRKTQEYVKPEGKFEGTTTSNADFGLITGERRQAIRHKDELVLSGDALQDATTAKHDYPEWEVQQREKRKTQEYVKPEGKFEGMTTTNADFGLISGERRQAIRHKDELVLSGDALQDATTAKHDYPEWEVQQREKRKTQEYVKPEGKFEGTTTSNADFGLITGERRQAIRHKDELVLSGDALQDATTAKHDYPEWEVQQREKRKTQEYVKPEGKFEGMTTSNADFGLISGERRQAIRHKDELVLSGDALQDATTAKHDYPEWEVQQREKRKTQEYVKPEGKFEGMTTSNADFGLISGERRQAIRHKDELVLSGDALQYATTAKHDYPEWEVQQREKRKTQEYVKPEGKFEGMTTSNADFGLITGERRQAIRHKDELVLSGDALQDATTAKHDYPEWEIQQREKRKTQEYVKPEGRFEDMTTNVADYGAKFVDTTTNVADFGATNVGRRQAIYPKSNELGFKGDFETVTTSKDHYKAYEGEKTESFKPMVAAAVSQEPFESSTTAKQDYPEWEVHAREKRVHPDYVKPEGKFEGTTTSNADFGLISGERRQAIRHKDELVLAGDAFQDATTAKNDYPEWEVQHREKRKQPEYVKPEGKFESTTTSNAAYNAQGSPKRTEAIRPKTSQKLLEGKFEGATTSNADYGVATGERRQAIRHKDELVLAGDAFQDATTAKNDYPEWEVQQREKRKHLDYVKPEGIFESTTTSSAAYMAQGSPERRQAIRPKTSQKLLDGEFEGTTTSNAHYQSHVAERTQLIKPKDQSHLSNDAFDGSTTAKNDYPEWEVQQREKRKTQEYVKPEGRFESTTTSNAAYNAQGSPKRTEAIRPKTSQKLLDGKFEGTTTSNADYGVVTGERRQAIRHKDELVLAGDAFQDATTAKNDYPVWEVQQREKRKTQEYVKPEGKFESTTTSNAAYNAQGSPKRTEAIRPKTSQKLLDGKFEGTTTSNADYGVVTGERRQAIRHKDELVLAGDAFQDATTAKNDYPEWEVQQREKRIHPEYVKPEGKFESTTTSNAAYNAQGSPKRTEAIRPKTSQKLLDGKFEGTTTSNADYGVVTGERRQAIRHKDELVLAGDAFQDATTAKNDYPEWEVQQREKRIHPEYVKPEGKFESTTTSNAAYNAQGSPKRTEAIRPKTSQKLLDGKFEGTTTSNADYGVVTGERRQAIRHKDELVLAGDAFQDATTAKNDYPEWEVQHREKRKHVDYVKPEGKFESTTTSNAAYKPQGSPERREAIRPKTSQKLLGGKFEGTTTSNAHYQSHKVERTQLIKPHDQSHLSNDLFDGSTTAKHDYPEWEVQAREKRVHSNYVKPGGKFEDITTSVADYGATKVEKRQAIRPKSSELGFVGIFQANTTSKDHYKAYEGGKTESLKPMVAAAVSQAPFESTTTSQQEYPAWEVQQREKRKIQEYVKPDGKFDGTTTSNAAYVAQGNQERREAIRPKTNQKLLDGDFEGTTTSKAHYQSPRGERAQAIRPHDSTILSTDPFVGSTTANQDYPEWKIEGRQRRMPVEYIKPDGEFYSTTTNQTQFKNVPSERTQLIKPNTSTVLSQEPFDGTTTQKSHFVGIQQTERQKSQRRRTKTSIANDPFEGETSNLRDYKQWEVKAPSPRRREAYVKPEGDFDMVTTQKAHYTDVQANQRTTAIRPTTNTKLGEGAFESNTTSKGDYKQWIASPSKKVTVVQEYQPPTHKFSATTTSKSDFPAYAPGDRSRAIKNVGSTIKFGSEDSPFAGGTSYKAQFAPNSHICPVSLFGTEKSEFQYKAESGGHKFYNPIIG